MQSSATRFRQQCRSSRPERAIDAASAGATVILLRAVDPATLRRIADAGEGLPQKTTYSYPKMPAGLVVRSLDV